MVGIAQNHPFIQGNKRTGFIACVAFLEANQCAFHLEDFEGQADRIVDVLTGRSSEEALVAAWSKDVEDFTLYAGS